MTKKEKIKASKKSALKRFEEDFGDLEIKGISVMETDDNNFQTTITIAEQEVDYGDSWYK